MTSLHQPEFKQQEQLHYFRRQLTSIRFARSSSLTASDDEASLMAVAVQLDVEATANSWQNLGDKYSASVNVTANYNDSENGDNREFGTIWTSSVSINYTVGMMAVVAGLLTVVIVVTAIGNAMVGLALFRYRQLRTVSNLLIGNLALSDFLLATTILPLSTVNECIGYWALGRTLCHVWLTLDVLYCTASIWNLCIIAFDRFTATLFPVWYRGRRTAPGRQAAIYAVAVWTVAAMVCVPPVLGWNESQLHVFDEDTGVHKCNLFETRSYVIYSACGSFFVPFFVTLFFYLYIFGVLRNRARKSDRKGSKAGNLGAAAEKASKKIGIGKKSKSNSEKSNIIKTLTTKTELTATPASAAEAGSNTTGAVVVNVLVSPSSDLEDSMSRISIDGNSFFLDTISICEPADLTSSSSKQVGDNDFVALGNELLPPSAVTGVPKTDVKTTSGNGICKLSPSASMPLHPKQVASPSPASETITSLTVEGGRGLRPSFSLRSSSSFCLSPFLRRKSSAVDGLADRAVEAVASSAKRQHRTGYEQRELRATVRMAIIIAFFCCFWLGFFVVYVVRGCCPDCQIPRALDAFFFWLGYTNSSVNPILYTIFNDEFRRAFQKILGIGDGGGKGRNGKSNDARRPGHLANAARS